MRRHSVRYSGMTRGHVRRWDMASDLVGDTYKGANRIPAAQGPTIMIKSVRTRKPGLAAPTWRTPSTLPGRV